MKNIFVGSSSEAKPYAEAVCKILQLPGIRARVWSEFFNVSYVAIETIEDVNQRCSGAVLIASPDDVATLRGRQVQLPRANVILELGMLSASFGRPSVALCKFSEVELPTDLSGFTYLSLDTYEKKASAEEVKFSNATVNRLQEWARGLQDTLDEVPRVASLHGYRGKWKVVLNFKRWRPIEIGSPAYAKVTGLVQLNIPFDGQRGEGAAYGELSLRLIDLEGKRKPYTASAKVMDEVQDVRCSPDASLRFTSETFVRHVTEEEGEPWVPGYATPVWPTANRFNWQLRPREDCLRTLVGTYKTDDERSIADVVLEKV